MRRFVAFLAIVGVGMGYAVQSREWINYPIAFVAYLFHFEHVKLSSIGTYLAGVQHFLSVNDVPVRVWSKALSQQIKGHEREEEVLYPDRKKVRLPFTRHMILKAWALVLSVMTDRHQALAIYAALCLAFIFLFRKSEFLTGNDRKPKVINGKTATLIAKNLQFHYPNGDVFSAADGMAIPERCPEFMSMHLLCSKNDQIGKGASRFAPSDPSNPHCAVRIVHAYCRTAGLRGDSPVFAGPHVLVSDKVLTWVMKMTAQALGLPADLVSLHSIRIGGLVALMAAGISDELKALAGRWKGGAKSFLVYARGTLEQYKQITRALNDTSLVTAETVKLLYEHTFHGRK